MPLEDKICDRAMKLWNKWLYSNDDADYQNYLAHVKNCQECFRKAKALME